MVKKIVVLGVIAVMVLSLAGCENGNKYNAVMYSDAKEWMNENFLIENLTRDAVYDGIPLEDPLYPKNINSFDSKQGGF